MYKPYGVYIYNKAMGKRKKERKEQGEKSHKSGAYMHIVCCYPATLLLYIPFYNTKQGMSVSSFDLSIFIHGLQSHYCLNKNKKLYTYATNPVHFLFSSSAVSIHEICMHHFYLRFLCKIISCKNKIFIKSTYIDTRN